MTHFILDEIQFENLTEQADELINFGDSQEKANGQGMKEILSHMKESNPKEQRVYMVNISNRQHPDELSDEQFMALAEEQGTVWSINGFADDFNKEIIDFNNKIRII